MVTIGPHRRVWRLSGRGTGSSVRAGPVAAVLPELHCHQCIPRRVGTSSVAGSRKRILRDVLLGACLGAIGAALVWQFYPGFWKEPPVAAHEIAMQRRAQEEAQQQAVRARLAAVRPVAPPATCDLEPLIPASGAQDGHASMEHPFPGGPRARAKVFLRQAETATARGRLRDAEVALLAACREHDAASAGPTVPLARVLGMLGERYADAARAQDSPVLREQLVARAGEVLALSAQAYAIALGPNASRSRLARQRLARLDQDLVAAADAPQPAAGRLGDEAAPARPQPAQDRGSVESGPELNQLASDLARLRAQAEAVSEDPAGFRRRAEVARAQREQCRDAACLREWYGKRRRQLLAEF